MRLQRSALSVRAGLVAVALMGFAGSGHSEADAGVDAAGATAQQLYDSIVGKMGIWECLLAWHEYYEAKARGENPPQPECDEPSGPSGAGES